MPLLKTKFTNRITAILPKELLKITLRNININGVKKGCSGHITYLPTGRCVYINTEPLTTDLSKVMYRLAKNESDFSSNSPDFWAINLCTTAEKLPEAVARTLQISDDKLHFYIRQDGGARNA